MKFSFRKKTKVDEEIQKANHSTQAIVAEPEEQIKATVDEPKDAAVQALEKERSTPWYKRLTGGLSKTRKALGSGLFGLIIGKKEIDEDLLDEIEMALLQADMGVVATEELIEGLQDGLNKKSLKDPQAVIGSLKQHVLDILKPCEQPLVVNKQHKPYIILMVGVNGAGKTTTIGKLTHRLLFEGHSVLLAAGDTFRAAAVEQLGRWASKLGVPMISQKAGADSASVIYDAIESAKSRGTDVVIADTAGRLQTQHNLMAELKKIVKVIKKTDPDAPHEVLLVLDAGTGQNALSQAKSFKEAVDVTGLVLTKLEGTAKGGMVVATSKVLGLPLRFIGVGEGVDDLQTFDSEAFVNAIFDTEEA